MNRFWRKMRNVMANTGWRGTAAFVFKEKSWRLARRMRLPLPSNRIYKLYSKFAPAPVFARFGASDRIVFRHILANLEYDCLGDDISPRLIVDCGANVGYASVFFLGKYPGARVMAIEPDPDNFGMLQKNLAAFGPRATAVQSAVWSHAAALSIRRGQFGDGREWATQVVETPPGEKPDMRAVDVAGVLAASGFPRIDILKVDIERAEIVLFGRDSEKWLKDVDNIVIELHDAECEKVFFQALQKFSYHLSRRGELTVVKKLSAKTAG